MAGDKASHVETVQKCQVKSHKEGAHEDLSKYYIKASTQKFDEYPKWPSSYTGGVIPMNLKGRFDHERQRMSPDFDEKQRQWRVKYIKAQELHPNEPYEVKQLYYEYNNIFRRIMKYPLNQFQKLLEPKLGKENSFITRRLVGNVVIAYLFFCTSYYFVKYNRATWEHSARGVFFGITREPIYPGEKGYPQRTQSWQHFDLDFSKRKVFLGDYTTSTSR